MTKHLISTAIGLVGFALVATYAGWSVAVGVLLMLWGNNIQNREITRRLEN